MAVQWKACPKCKEPALIHAQRCQRCGHAYRTRFSPPPYQTQLIQAPPGYPESWESPRNRRAGRRSHPVAAAILAAALLGGWAGMLLNRQPAKALVFLAVLIGLALATRGLALIVLYPAGLVDVALIARRLDRGDPVGPWQCF